jgi:hypothetical protein
MLANFDGTGEQKVAPKDGVIQDTPVFDPTPTSTKLAWTEFNATTFVAGFGPKDYGVWIQDFSSNTGRYACKSNADGSTPGATMLPGRDTGAYRCFGEHLSWPGPNTLMLGQDLLFLHLDDGSLSTIWGQVMQSIQTQQTGFPVLSSRGDGFFPPFPISASWAPDASRFVFDGLIASIAGDNPTLSFLISAPDGGNVYRIPVDGYSNDSDTVATSNFLFSVATPQIMPFLSR